MKLFMVGLRHDVREDPMVGKRVRGDLKSANDGIVTSMLDTIQYSDFI